MTITSITKLPSGKTGATITSNLDELAILRGLVVNALRHMPDVGETTSTRQRLKAMSRVLHRVYSPMYSNVSFTESTTQATPEQVDKIVAMIRDSGGRVRRNTGCVGEGHGKNWVTKNMQTELLRSLLAKMPDKFTYLGFTNAALEQRLCTEGEAVDFLASLGNGSKDWAINPIERTVTRFGVDPKPSPFVGEQCGKNWAKKYMEAEERERCRAERDWIDRHRGITNPNYVSHTANPVFTESDKPVPTPGPHPNNSTDLKQSSVPEEDRSTTTEEAPPKLPTNRTTLFEVYEKMDEKFAFETFTSRAAEYGHDRPKVSAFVTLMCNIGSLRHMGGFLYEKISSVTSPQMRHLASLIA